MDKNILINNSSGFFVYLKNYGLFFSSFKQISIVNSIFDLYINDSFLHIEGCTLDTRLFSGSYSLLFSGTVKFNKPQCPFIFYESYIKTLYFENLNPNNSVVFLKVNNSKNGNLVIQKLVIFKSHLTINSKFFNYKIINYLLRLVIKESFVEEIEDGVLDNLEYFIFFIQKIFQICSIKVFTGWKN